MMKFLNNYQNHINEKFIEYKYPPISTTFDVEVLDLFEHQNIKDIIYKSNYSDDDIKTVNKFLRNNKYKAIKLYHGTSNEFDIFSKGLKTTKDKTKKSYQSETGYVYLSVFKDSAKTFGEIAYPHSTVAVYTVNAQIIHLKPDLDQLFNIRREGLNVGNTLADSLLYGHGFRIKGDIPPYMIIEKETF